MKDGLAPETLAAQALRRFTSKTPTAERLLRARIPDVVSVVDVTDHEAGENPFYPPGKR